MRLTWGAFYVFLYIYRCAASVFAQLVVTRLTMIADTTGYQNVGAQKALGIATSMDLRVTWLMRGVATDLTEIVGGIFGTMFGGSLIMINIGFQTLAFAGIVMLLHSVDPRLRKWLAALVMLPSFTIWSSIAAKEPIVVLLVCIVLKYVVDIYRNRDSFGLRHAATLVLLYVYKPHFLPAIIFLIGVSRVARQSRIPTTLALAAGSFSMFVLYLMRDVVDRVGLLIGIWTNEPGGSSRPGAFIFEKYDIFVKAPEGMLLAFMGPTLAEASGKVLHLVSYIESAAMLLVLLAYSLTRLPRAPAYSYLVSTFTLFWILFAVYPLGVNNPGTAVRFRTDYILIIYFAVIVLLDRRFYLDWRHAIARRRQLRPKRVRLPRFAFARA